MSQTMPPPLPAPPHVHRGSPRPSWEEEDLTWPPGPPPVEPLPAPTRAGRGRRDGRASAGDGDTRRGEPVAVRERAQAGDTVVPREQWLDPDVEPKIRIRGLTKSFGARTILEDLTFDIPKGKVTVVLGPSGTGKSVFLRHLIGLLRPDRGELWVDDHNVPTLRNRELLEVRKKFGVLFQDGALFGSMHVYDNVAFPLREHTRKSEREIREIVMEKLGLVGLTDAAKLFPGEISGGMKKRAGLARGLVLDPEILLFDEPDSGLDPVRTAFLNELILDLKDKLDSTFVVVTHHIPTAKNIGDHLALLYRRNLMMAGPKELLLNSDMPVVRQFLRGSTRGPIGMSEEKDSNDPSASYDEDDAGFSLEDARDDEELPGGGDRAA